jgi:hypothetical protein
MRLSSDFPDYQIVPETRSWKCPPRRHPTDGFISKKLNSRWPIAKRGPPLHSQLGIWGNCGDSAICGVHHITPELLVKLKTSKIGRLRRIVRV